MRFSYGRTFLLGFGYFGVSVIWGVYNAFVPVFLAQRFGLGPAVIGFFMTLDNLAALLIQPPVGALSDRLRTPLGRRLPFILIGAPLAALAFGLLPLAAALPVFVACTTTLLLSMALWRTPVIALMPDLTPSAHRSQASGIINFMGGLGSILAFLAGASLYEQNPAFPFWMGSGLVLGAAALVLIFIREPRDYAASEALPGLGASLREVWRDPDPSGRRLLLAVFFYFLGYSALEAFFNLYALHHLGISEADGTRLLGQLVLIFVLCALPAGYLGAALGRRRTIRLGLGGMALMLTAAFGTPPAALTLVLARLPVLGNVRVLSVLLMLAGAACALAIINFLPMVVDLTSAARLGTYTGLYFLFSTLANVAGPNVNGWVIQLAGGDYNAILLLAPASLGIALALMAGVRRGEAPA